MTPASRGDLRPAKKGAAPDRQAVRDFAQRLLGFYTGGLVSFMVDLGDRAGLFEAAARGPATSAELAQRAGLSERPVREWLGSLVAAGVFDYEPSGGVYSLPPERAMCLTGDSPYNMSARSRVVANLSRVLPDVSRSLADGKGVPYERYMPEFTEQMDELGRRRYDAVLVDGYLAKADGLVERLRAGIEVADVGCGAGHCLNLMARAFPRSRFTGYEFSEGALARARQEAAEMGLENTRFVPLNVAELPAEPPLDLVTAFDVVHDLAAPGLVLRRIHDALQPDGLFVMVDIKASSRLEENLGNPMAPYLYALSLMHCLQVSLAQDGAGLGAAWGEQLARQMLEEAGFREVRTAEPPLDPVNLVYVCRKGPG